MYNPSESITHYFKELASKSKPLSKEEEFELADKIQAGCTVSLERLVTANLKFAITIARKFLHMGLSEDDLIQEANIAMITAAKRFTREKNTKFITFASWYVRKACNESIVEKGKTVRLPMHKEIELYKQRVAGESISHSRTVEVDAPAGDDGKNTIGDLMLKDYSNVEHQHHVDHLKQSITDALNTLSERDREVIKAFYGVGYEYPVSIDDIAEEHNLTSTRINQIMRSARKQLANVLSDFS